MRGTIRLSKINGCDRFDSVSGGGWGYLTLMTEFTTVPVSRRKASRHPNTAADLPERPGRTVGQDSRQTELTTRHIFPLFVSDIYLQQAPARLIPSARRCSAARPERTGAASETDRQASTARRTRRPDRKVRHDRLVAPQVT